MKLRHPTVALALVLAFNSGAFARPSASDDDADTALISQDAKPAKSSFGERMKAVRQAKTPHAKKARTHKTKLGKTPKAPRIAKTPDIGD